MACCSIAMNIWMQMTIPLLFFGCFMLGSGCGDVSVREWVG